MYNNVVSWEVKQMIMTTAMLCFATMHTNDGHVKLHVVCLSVQQYMRHEMDCTRINNLITWQ